MDSVLVVMPTTNLAQASKTASILRSRAGVPCRVLTLFDRSELGFVALVNQAVQDHPAEYYVYTAQDAFPSRDWLAIALDTMQKAGAGLVGFNDGKWHGSLASFGLVHRSFLLYSGLLFFPGYKRHFADYELTILAQRRSLYSYNPASVLMEVDYNKDSTPSCDQDRHLFFMRQREGFRVP